jgi:DNA-damage-inducible protein D
MESLESIKRIRRRDNVEYWFARELQSALEYKEWRNFTSAIDRAKDVCKASNIPIVEHFIDVEKSYRMPNGGRREIGDIAVTRFGCHLIAKCGDQSKEAISKARLYFGD